MMKGQAGFEFYAAILLFVIAITYVFFQITTAFPKGLEEIRRQTLLSEAFQISEILIKDAGEPNNWYLDVLNAKRIGLANESFSQLGIISFRKSKVVNDTCNLNYNLFKKLLGLNYDVGILLKHENVPIINCTRPYSGIYVAKISRIVSFENRSYGELTVWVY